MECFICTRLPRLHLSLFESTIRYVGGLISAYELGGKQYPGLLAKAQQLADRLSIAWSNVSIDAFDLL